MFGEVEVEGVLQEEKVERNVLVLNAPWDVNVSSELVQPLSIPTHLLTKLQEEYQWLDTGGVYGPRMITLPTGRMDKEGGGREEDWVLDRTVLTREECFPLDEYILRARRSQELESMTEWEEVIVSGKNLPSPGGQGVKEEEHETVKDLGFVRALMDLSQRQQ